MYQLAGIVLLLLCPTIAFFTPLCLRHPKARTLVQRILGRLPRIRAKVGYQAIDRHRLPPVPSKRARSHALVRGGVLAASIIGGVLVFGAFPDSKGTDFARLRNAVLSGAFMGGLCLAAAALGHSALLSLRCGGALSRLGLRGVWRKSPQPGTLPFQAALLKQIDSTGTLDALSENGLDVLNALSHPAHAPLAVPHAALAGATLRLILLPPRSTIVDPERKRSSCAEEALVRRRISPEQHWRDLQRALEAVAQWQAKADLRIQVRFLEARPAMHALMSGTSAWFRPWLSDGTVWLDATSTPERGDLFDLARDGFLSAWATAAEELSYSLAAGPTSSTVLRKGLEPTQLRLIEA